MTMACPGCAAGALAAEEAIVGNDVPTHEILLPTIHCISCVTAVERILLSKPDIKPARVNLSRKRAVITATSPDIDPKHWINAIAAAGFEAHEAKATQTKSTDMNLLLRLGVAGFAMMNVMLLSVAVWSGAAEVTREFFHWVSALIALPATVFCAQPFFSSAFGALRSKRLNMDVPISLAIILASGMSLFETMIGGTEAYFDAALSLTFFLLIGRYLEKRMRSVARSAAADLAALEPARINCIQGNEHISKKIDDVRASDILWLSAGSRVPVDAELQADIVMVDGSAITGESDPVSRVKGSILAAGEVVLTGPVRAKCIVDAKHSTLRRMIELTSLAEGARGRYTSLADKAAGLYAPLVHGLAILAFIAWVVATSDVYFAITVAISTLIITCPCALGLAVPAVTTVATGRLYRNGVLVKSETALERMAEVDTVIFDKTGTLTQPKLNLPKGMPVKHQRALKALAQASQHPLSQSLLPQLKSVSSAVLHNTIELVGKGIRGECDKQDVWLGAVDEIGTAFRFGKTTYPLPQVEEIIPGVSQTISELQKMGLTIHLLTGDTENHARFANQSLGCDRVHAQVTPEHKQQVVQSLQDQGLKPLMVGDGLNDTIAMTAAWASAAPGSALEVSQNAADIVMLSKDLRQLPSTLRIAKASKQRILENFGIAVVYNSVAIPLAVAGFATPLLAALAMSSSSILVTLNALRIRA